MLSRKENDLLTRVGPGTPAGELLRRYWHPIAVAAELKENPVKRVRVLGEDLVLFCGANGPYGLVAERCSHRGASLAYGKIEGDNIRCPYHGWLYDREGHCLEQPAEPGGSTYKNRIKHPAYTVEKLAGLLFGYMGPRPAPLLPQWDVLVRNDGSRRIRVKPQLDCNWLQPMENSVDPSHTFYLHGSRTGPLAYGENKIERLEYEVFDYGIMKKRFVSNGKSLELVNAHPLVFPNILRNHREWHSLEYRVPVDDTHTQIYSVSFRPSKDGSIEEHSNDPAVEYLPTYKDSGGVFKMDIRPDGQDYMAWETAGPIYDRSKEHLATTDKGIITLRKLFKREIQKVKRGKDPLGVVRDPEKNKVINFNTIYKAGT